MKKNISTADKIVRYQTPLTEVFTLDHEGAVCTGSIQSMKDGGNYGTGETSGWEYVTEE